MSVVRFQEKYEKQIPEIDNDEVKLLTDTHSLCSLTEVYGLSDPNRIRDISSAPTEYISAYESNKQRFRKTSIRTDTTFEFPGLGYFEKLSNNILRHKSRLNGEKLLLVETALWYDVLTQKDGQDILTLYKEKLNKIPAGNILGVFGQSLPTYVICSNNQVLKLRKTLKILQIPEFNPLSKEEKFARVLLYFPLKPGQDIDTDSLGWYKQDEFCIILECLFKMLTIIQEVLVI